MRIRTVGVVLSGLCVAGLTGCHQESWEDACPKLNEAFLQYTSRCAGGDIEVWKKLDVDYYRCNEIGKSIAAGRRQFEASKVQTCLDTHKNASCAEMGNSLSDNLCTTMLVPLVAEGESAYEAGECVSGSLSFEAGSCLGKCLAEARKPSQGEACDSSAGQWCASGLLCSYPEKVCKPLPAEGEACSSSTPCATGLYCDLLSGTCKVPKTSGPCNTRDDCRPPYRCLPEASSEKTCTLPKKAGEACTPGQNVCERFTACAESTNTCVTWGEAGQPCGMVGPMEVSGCIASWCTDVLGSGTCSAYLSLGAACENNRDQCGPGWVGSPTCDASQHCAEACHAP